MPLPSASVNPVRQVDNGIKRFFFCGGNASPWTATVAMVGALQSSIKQNSFIL